MVLGDAISLVEEALRWVISHTWHPQLHLTFEGRDRSAVKEPAPRELETRKRNKCQASASQALGLLPVSRPTFLKAVYPIFNQCLLPRDLSIRD